MRAKPVCLKVGDKINGLTVVRLDHKDKNWRKYYLFRCECGKTKVIHGASVVSGNTKSCGCLVKRSAMERRISDTRTEVTAIILGYKRHAKSRGFEWSLSRDVVERLIQRDCTYCSSPPSNRKKTKNSIGEGMAYTGIDRVDSSLGYVDGNVVPSCKLCNYAKQTLPLDEFQAWAIRLGKNAMAEQWG